MEVPSIFINRILAESAKKSASSLHLSVGSVPIIRTSGELNSLDSENILTVTVIDKIIESLLEENELAHLKKEKEITVVKNIAGNFRFRINIFYQKDLPSVSFNYISGQIKKIEELDLPKAFNKILNLNSGLVVIAGPNDSGKTTTAATFIEELNNNEKRYVITLENPIEYLFVNKKSIIEQRQIGRDVENYNEGINHSLNEDVDLVYIDEIKDEFNETIQNILELASGNSLVILEMNADSSLRVIEKIIVALSKKTSLEAARFNLADTLVAIVVQKLIPSRGGGQALVAEVLIVNSAIKSLIREGKIYQIESIIQTSREEGMISMARAIAEQVKAGKINQTEIEKLKLNS
ncbi:MAG: ATPase, T2SS/T4P/T4SS family [Patescibacteria group bacterium]